MPAKLGTDFQTDMSASTHGLRLNTASERLRTAIEVLSSMRFAIALLTVICIASVIGTVLKQHEPLPNYVNQFGPFWAEVFNALKTLFANETKRKFYFVNGNTVYMANVPK